jgi:hypothetical protein
MANKKDEALRENVLDYLGRKLIIPLFEEFYNKYNCCDDNCFRLFTEDLANDFNEWQPDYFENDYSKRIVQYYYSSLYGEPIGEDALMAIIKTEEHEDFNGVDILFECFDSIEYSIEDCLRDLVLEFNSLRELIIIMRLKELNEKNLLLVRSPR